MNFSDRLDRAYARSVEAISSAHSKWLEPDPVDDVDDEGPMDTERFKRSEEHREAIRRRVDAGGAA